MSHLVSVWRAAQLVGVARGVLQQQVREGAVIVSEPFVNLRKLPNQGRGVTLRLLSDQGLREFPIAAVYYDYAAGAGTIIMDDAVYRRLWNDRAITSIARAISSWVASRSKICWSRWPVFLTRLIVSPT